MRMLQVRGFQQLSRHKLNYFFGELKYLSAKSTNTAYRCGDELSGYTITGADHILDFDAHVTQLRHNQTGAHHLHIARDDSNNTFSVGFKTIPMDSTGVSHILEHTTLCGSRRYPVRDPFFKMLTRSLSNFMNAFTANDWTMYLYSTQNKQDFQNLMSVYLDCVFYPRLRYLDFCQEGWRLEHQDIENTESPITFKGVVFNEMKGCFANSESIYAQALQNLLYPSHTYSHVSGGMPMNILDLSWEKMKEFHSTQYNPSNSYFFTYGDMPLEDHLGIIQDSVLSKFEKQSPCAIDVPHEIKYTIPVTKHIHCPTDPTCLNPMKQITISKSYLLGPITDIYESFILKVLCLLLMDGPASPLYESLFCKNLGSNLSPCSGYNDDTLESYFSIGLQGVGENDIGQVESIIIETFKQVAEHGFSKSRIESVLHQVELHMKYQKKNLGLMLATSIISPWIYKSNPVDALHISRLVEKFKHDLVSDEKFLQHKIETYFLNNNHCLTLIMSPSVDYELSLKKSEDRKLESIVEALTDIECNEVYDRGIELRNDQNSVVDVSCLPTILLTDVDKKIQPVELTQTENICPLQLCVQPTNGVTYMNIAADFSHIADDFIMYIPFFCYAITRMGAGDLNFSAFSQQCDSYSGGLSTTPLIISNHSSASDSYKEILCSSYCLDHNFAKMLSLWEEVFLRANMLDKVRLSSLLKQLANDMANGIADSGHVYAMTLSSSTILPSSKCRELLFGLSQIKFLKDLSGEPDISKILDIFVLIAREVFNVDRMRFSVTTSTNCVDSTKESILALCQHLPSSNQFLPTAEGLKMKNTILGNGTYGNKYSVKLPYPVSYVGQSFQTVPYTHEDCPRLQVMTRLLSSKYLHRQIREIGGAYGSAAIQDNSILSFISYRDPNYLNTLSVFENCVQWIKKGEYTDEDLDECKLSVFSQIDSPLQLKDKGSSLFLKRLSNDQLQNFRDSLFSVQKCDVLSVCERYIDVSRSNTAIIGSQKTNSPNWTNLEF